MMLGSYLFDMGNEDTVMQKTFFICLLLFFGGILVVYELTIADEVAEWWDSSELNFLWNAYILKSYNNLSSEQLEAIEGIISAEKDRDSIFYKHLTVILKRNGR